MKYLKRKRIIGIILIAVLASAYFLITLTVNLALKEKKDDSAAKTRVKVVSDSLDKYTELYTKAEERIHHSRMEKAEISAETLRALSVKEWDGKTRLFRDGALIRIHEDEVDLPDGVPEDVIIKANQIQGESGTTYTGTAFSGEGTVAEEIDPEEEALDEIGLSESDGYALYYFRVNGPFYYVEWEPFKNIYEELQSYFNSNEMIDNLEEALGVNVLLLLEKKDNEGNYSVLYSSRELPSYLTADKYGITDAESGVIKAVSSGQEKVGTLPVLKIGGALYESYCLKQEKLGFILICLFPYTNSAHVVLEQSLVVTILFLLICIVLFVWYFTMIRLVYRHSLNEDQKKEFSPEKTKTRMRGVILAGGGLIAVAILFTQSLISLYNLSSKVSSSLGVVDQALKENDDRMAISRVVREDRYAKGVRYIADLLTEYPELQTSSQLSAFGKIIHSDYLVLFDHNGKGLVSDSEYMDLSLGSGPLSAIRDFSTIFNGVPLLTEYVEEDRLSGEARFMFGACVGKPGDEKGYRGLLVAIPAEQIYSLEARSPQDIIDTMVDREALCFILNPEDRIIKAASRKSYVGRNAVELGLPETALHDDFNDFFEFNDRDWYGMSAGDENSLCYLAAGRTRLYQDLPGLVIIGAAFAMLFLLIMTSLLYKGYREYFEEHADTGEELQDTNDMIDMPDGQRKYSRDPLYRWKTMRALNGSRTPINHAMLAVEVLAALFIAGCAIILWTGRHDSRRSLIIYILNGNWVKGFHMFAYARILILFFEIFLLLLILKAALSVLKPLLGTRGETVCRLCISLLNYAGVIGFVYYALMYLGFDPATLLASLGLLSFALSLGAKDLVTDILAGLSIVFEGDYQVGDIIDVGGYRGTVLEIGVRTTKLEGRGGNVKIISNRDVKNIINMTRENSWVPLELRISSDETLSDIEAFLAEELPAIGASIQEIVSGPYYKGILSFNNGVTTLSVVAECKEIDYYEVQRKLNRAVRDLFGRHNIKLM